MIDRIIGYGISAVLVLFVAAIVVQTDRLRTAKLQAEQLRTQVQQERAVHAAAAASASESYRAAEQARIRNQREADREADRFAERARADRAAADRMHERLLDQARIDAAACRRAAPGNPGDVAASASASTPGDLLADVLGRIDQAAGDLAAFADAAAGAGAACERERDALTTR